MDRLIEIILTAAVWGFQIGAVVLAGLAVWYVVRSIAVKVGKRPWPKLVCILLVFVLMSCLAMNPPLVGNPGSEVSVKEMSEELRSEIMNLNRGLYTLRLPLFPLYIEVLEFDGEQALVKTHYFPAGTVEREHGPDGPSITKTLN